MKKSLNKVIVTLAAVTALTAAMAVTASAAVVATQDTVGGKTTITANVTGRKAGEQVTMLVLKPGVDKTKAITEDDIAYIDQKAADDKGAVKFEMPIGTTTANEKYELLSGSTSATEADQGEVVIPGATETIKYGDVNGDNIINGLDALQTQYFSLKMNGVICTYTDESGNTIENPTVNAELFARADVNKDKMVNGLDALNMQYYSLKMSDHVIDDSWNPANKWSKEQ